MKLLVRASIVLLVGCTDGARGGQPLDDDGEQNSAGSDGAVAPADAAKAPPLRFVALGDTGTGEAEQKAVAEAVRQKCAADGCEFAVLLGDNIYESGAESVDDPVWQSAFEQPYADIDLPFYAVMGNHDYGGKLLGFGWGGLGNEFEQGPVAVEYTHKSSKWKMPATFYTQRFGDVALFALDTNSIMWSNTDNGDQRGWLPDALTEHADATWKIALGHHPYLSNGNHGNAGEYNGIEGLDIPIPIDEINGIEVKTFFDDQVCGKVDLYLSGHDHNRQWLDEPERCPGTELVVSGASGKLKAFKDAEDNATRWQDDTELGFFYVVIDGDRLTGSFVDVDGDVSFEHMLTK